jgi:hypothetical protein
VLLAGWLAEGEGASQRVLYSFETELVAHFFDHVHEALADMSAYTVTTKIDVPFCRTKQQV